jgi:hypothetical protein
MLRRTWERLAAVVTGIPATSEARRDPWRRLPLEPPLRAFGPGASDDFASYLARDSTVEIRDAGEAAQWLLQCRYASDADLHGEADAWLHPVSLELLRCGDCEDFALWGWRKLVELGLDAHFVVGVRHQTGGLSERHAWVLYEAADELFVFDGVERSVDRIVRPLRDVGARYEPQVGVTPAAGRYAFAGLFISEWGRRLALQRIPRTR